MLDLFFQVLVGGGEHAHVHLDGAGAADPLELLLLEDAQHLGLALQAHVADLVEEQGGAVGQVELALARLGGAGEGALDVAEQLGFDQFLGDGGAVHRHHGMAAALRLGVDGLGHQLLAGAVAAADEHPGVGGRDPVDLLAQLLHERAVTDEPHPVRAARAQQAVFAFEPRDLQPLADGEHGLVVGKRLLDEVEGAHAGGLHRGLHRAVAADHDHRQVGEALADDAQPLQAVHTGQPDVEQDQVHILLVEQLQPLLGRTGGQRGEALVAENAREGLADGGFVVDDEDGIGHGRGREQRGAAAGNGFSGASYQGWSGSSTVKTVPVGWLSRARMVPPCSLTMVWAMARPSPVPDLRVEK